MLLLGVFVEDCVALLFFECNLNVVSGLLLVFTFGM